jgi:hypothetical protein
MEEKDAEGIMKSTSSDSRMKKSLNAPASYIASDSNGV